MVGVQASRLMQRSQQPPEWELATPISLPGDLSGLHHLQLPSAHLPPITSPDLWHALPPASDAVSHQPPLLFGLEDDDVPFSASELELPLGSPKSWIPPLADPDLALEAESPTRLLATLKDVDVPWAQLDDPPPPGDLVPQPPGSQAVDIAATQASAVPLGQQAGIEAELHEELALLSGGGFQPQSSTEVPSRRAEQGRKLLEGTLVKASGPDVDWLSEHGSAAPEQPLSLKPSVRSVSAQPVSEDDGAAALEALNGSGRTFRRFAKAATKRLMREVLLPGSSSHPESLKSARAVLQVECKRQRLLSLQLRHQMMATVERHAVTQAKLVRISGLLSRLERMRQDSRPWVADTREILQIVEDLNEARQHGASITATRGWQFGERCRLLSPHPTWLLASESHKQLVPMALAYGGGNNHVSQARVSLSCGPFAATPMSVNDLARMTSACYQATYCSFIERIKALFALADEGDSKLKLAIQHEVHDLITEFLLIDHTFFVHHPAHYTVADAWVLAEGVSKSGTPLTVFKHALDSARMSLEQRTRVWEIWDARTEALQRNEAERECLQQEIAKTLEALRAAESDADYSDLMALVDQLRANMDESSVINSVAISQTTIEVLTPLQIASIISTCYPYVLEVPPLYEHGIIPRP